MALSHFAKTLSHFANFAPRAQSDRPDRAHPMAEHGNSGYNVKNLRGTSGCKHYKGLGASVDSTTKCAFNGCKKDATRACHVISSNQNAQTGVRKIIYMCPSHNGIYGDVLNVRANALTLEFPDCTCGTL
eukprot:Unigene19993_Nuclearia_a/m.55594 Unigene19993_Nuclearia_a/g.55594  ORF Unigene19993_Nuclearia_a/g.55594 Unigene19993_Nuclearia_a/m.55594 type:complete len:130 (-) Unigene19993_Nuclearia_a:25-414(-)